MKAVMLYHPNSEFARLVETFVHEFERTKAKKIDLVSLETAAGSDMAASYDVVRYPALLVMKDNGELVKYWEGESLPLMDEVSAYF